MYTYFLIGGQINSSAQVGQRGSIVHRNNGVFNGGTYNISGSFQVGGTSINNGTCSIVLQRLRKGRNNIGACLHTILGNIFNVNCNRSMETGATYTQVVRYRFYFQYRIQLTTRGLLTQSCLNILCTIIVLPPGDVRASGQLRHNITRGRVLACLLGQGIGLTTGIYVRVIYTTGMLILRQTFTRISSKIRLTIITSQHLGYGIYLLICGWGIGLPLNRLSYCQDA